MCCFTLLTVFLSFMNSHADSWLENAEVRLYLDVLKSDATLDKPFQGLVSCYREGGKSHLLLSDVQQLAKKPEWEVQGQLLYARTLSNQSQPDEAFLVLSDVCMKHPEMSKAWLLKARVELDLKRLSDSLASYDSALKSSRSDKDIQLIILEQAEVLHSLGRTADAANRLLHLYVRTPGDETLYSLTLNKLERWHQYSNALQLVKGHAHTLSERGSDLDAVRLDQFRLLLTSGEDELAHNFWERYFETAKWNSVSRWLGTLRNHVKQKGSSSLLSLLKKRHAERAPIRWSVAYAACLWESNRADAPGILKLFGNLKDDWILLPDPLGRSECALFIGDLMAEAELLDEAVIWLARAAENNAGNSEIKWKLAGVYNRRGDEENRDTIYRELAVSEQETSQRARQHLYSGNLAKGKTLFSQARFAEALKYFQAAGQFAKSRHLTRTEIWQQLTKLCSKISKPTFNPNEEDYLLEPEEGWQVSAQWLLHQEPIEKVAPREQNEISDPLWSFSPPDSRNPICRFVTDDYLGFCLFRSGSMVALDLKSGLPVWYTASPSEHPRLDQFAISTQFVHRLEGNTIRSFTKDSGMPAWAYSSDEAIVCMVGFREKLYVLKGNGDLIGLSRDGEVAFTTTVFAQGSGRAIKISDSEMYPTRHGITVTGPQFIYFEDGKIRWRYVPPLSLKWGDKIARTMAESDVLMFELHSGKVVRVPLRWPLGYAFEISDGPSPTIHPDSGGGTVMRLDKNGIVHLHATRESGSSHDN